MLNRGRTAKARENPLPLLSSLCPRSHRQWSPSQGPIFCSLPCLPILGAGPLGDRAPLSVPLEEGKGELEQGSRKGLCVLRNHTAVLNYSARAAEQKCMCGQNDCFCSALLSRGQLLIRAQALEDRSPELRQDPGTWAQAGERDPDRTSDWEFLTPTVAHTRCGLALLRDAGPPEGCVGTSLLGTLVHDTPSLVSVALFANDECGARMVFRCPSSA